VSAAVDAICDVLYYFAKRMEAEPVGLLHLERIGFTPAGIARPCGRVSTPKARPRPGAVRHDGGRDQPRQPHAAGRAIGHGRHRRNGPMRTRPRTGNGTASRFRCPMDTKYPARRSTRLTGSGDVEHRYVAITTDFDRWGTTGTGSLTVGTQHQESYDIELTSGSA
jgi:hypothetical protein